MASPLNHVSGEWDALLAQAETGLAAREKAAQHFDVSDGVEPVTVLPGAVVQPQRFGFLSRSELRLPGTYAAPCAAAASPS